MRRAASGFFALSLLLFLPATASALFPNQGYGIGFAGSQMLEIPSHARTLGMGEAFVAGADDLGSLEVNPAGLTHLYAGMLKLQHREWFQDIRTDQISFGGLAGPIAFGGGFGYTYIEDDGVAEVIDGSGSLLGKFTPYNFQLGLAAAYGWKGFVSGGLQVRYFEEDFNIRFDQGVIIGGLPAGDIRLRSRATVMDFGVQGGYPKAGLSFGYSYTGLGSRFNGQILPEVQRLGVAWRPKAPVFVDNPMLLQFEGRFPIDRTPTLCYGFEWTLARALALRWGYVYPLYENLIRDGQALSLDRFRFGLGIGDDYFKIDYAFRTDSRLGQTHLGSITLGFGSSKPKPTPVKTEEPTPVPTPEETPTPTPEATAVVTEAPEAVLTPGIIPPGTRPVITRALAGNGRISLEWTPAYDGKIQGFFLKVRGEDGSEFRKPGVGKEKKGNRLALALANNKTYVVSVVIVYDAVNEGLSSDPVTLTPVNLLGDDEEVLFADLVPASLTGTINGEKMVLTWKNAIDERVGGTVLEMKQGDNGEYKRKGLIPAGRSTVVLTVKGGSSFPAGRYFYRVKHTNGLAGAAEHLSKPSRAIILTKKVKEGAALAAPSPSPSPASPSDSTGGSAGQVPEAAAPVSSTPAAAEPAPASAPASTPLRGQSEPAASQGQAGGSAGQVPPENQPQE